ncbi:MAG: hypothetical protein CMJ83_21330 [Planctomycetes bacterium]|nr:hypothetical protein [Planctomycetota bacterium]
MRPAPGPGAAIAVVALVFALASASPGQTRLAAPDVLAAFEVTTGTIQRLDVPAQDGLPFTLVIEIEGVARTVSLHPYSLRAPSFQVLVDGLQSYPVPQSATYRGAVEGYSSSQVALSRVGASLSGVIILAPGRPLIGVQPLREVVPTAPVTEHFVHDSRDNLPSPNVCGAAVPGMGFSPLAGGGGVRSGGVLEYAEIAYDCDYQFYQDNGSSIPATVQDTENILNAADLIYQNDVNIAYMVTTIIVRSSQASNPYTTNNPSGLLSQFQSYWLTNHQGVQRDIAHLNTGRNLSGSVIGIAYLGGVCSLGNGYGLSERYTSNVTSRTGLLAHELGHNWGAGHCSGGGCFIMCPGLGGCGGNLTQFSQGSQNAITAFAAIINCLSGPPQPPPLSSLIRAPRRLNPSGNNPGDQRDGLCVAARGHLVATAWSEQGGTSAATQDIFAAVSANEGNGFGPMTRVDLGDPAHATDSQNPQIVICSNDAIVCVWEDDRAGGGTHDILFSRSTDDGQTWSVAQPLNGTTSGAHVTSDVQSVRLAVSGTSVYACWLEDALSGPGSAQELRFSRSLDAGQTWTAPAVLNTQVPGHSNGTWPHNDASDPVIRAASDEVVIAYVDDRNQLGGQNQDDVFVLVSQNRGATFTETMVEGATPGDASQPVIALEGQRIAVAFEDDAGSGTSSIHAVASGNLGATWSAEATLSQGASGSPAAVASGVSLAISGANVLAAWVDDHVNPGVRNKAYTSRSADGGATWGSETELDQNASRANDRAEIVRTNRFAYVAIELGDAGSQGIGWAWSETGGATWQQPAVVAGTGGDVDFDSQTQLVATDPLHQTAYAVFWDDGTGGSNEAWVSAIKAPVFKISGQAALGSSVTLSVEAVPGATAIGSSFIVGLSVSGTSPSFIPFPGGPMMHFVPDALTFAALANPTILLSLQGVITFFGAGSGFPIPWPFTAPAPDITAVAIVYNAATGNVIYISDPITIVTQ